MSAFHAVGYGHPHTDHTFTEDDWTILDGPGVDVYGKSKTIAERAAWQGRTTSAPTTRRTTSCRDLCAACLGERGFALLIGRWRVLRHVTACPKKIGDPAQAARSCPAAPTRYGGADSADG
ncbi:hypothetical protein [Plantactinospora sp. KLBMP9567]|uniref:hypothetical protein n=1 Tax=Plantactinospora sp. KLBMP9567 TaxID=3085900 RepID=UPI002981D29A|nr:hypothetical protein [Plantactinospora sp. KLBMP9567]MDW5323587.1 hypothetical protein [Plantactinospora sp. KLBMP9567]